MFYEFLCPAGSSACSAVFNALIELTGFEPFQEAFSHLVKAFW